VIGLDPGVGDPGVVAERLDRLTHDEVRAVVNLAGAASDTDGAHPLSEHVMLHLRHGGDTPSVHLVIRDGDELIGYAHVDVTDPVDGPSAELVVHPMHRRRGLGRILVSTALEVAREADPAGRLRLWAHGDHPSAGALALSLGFRRARALWQMRRSLFAEMPELVPPPGVELRPFHPGQDEQAWLEVNRRAFADHPEQGRWELRDLLLRIEEPWFDRDGFLLAERVADGRILGFHWTKVHGHLVGDDPTHQHDPIGEVYVLGVDPEVHGTGLGRTLTIAGLRHLRALGLDQVMLYVDESNVSARSLYTRLGFARWSTDVLFTRDHLG
jgi:mycothiol synthase